MYVVNLNIFLISAATQMFLTALLTVLSDDGFQLPSPQAAEARKQALLLNDWCKKPEKNSNILQHFAENLIAKLSTPFKQIVFKQDPSAARFVSQRIMVWGGTTNLERLMISGLCGQTSSS